MRHYIAMARNVYAAMETMPWGGQLGTFFLVDAQTHRREYSTVRASDAV